MTGLRLLVLALTALLAACGLLPKGESPQLQEFSGVLLNDTEICGREVLITADLLVPKGVTLKICAGSSLRIRKSESTKIDPEYLSPYTEILVRGRLLVEGRAGDPVAFTPEGTVAKGEVGWAGLLLDRAAESVIRHATIERAEQGILCIASAPEISSNRIEGCRYGIVAQRESHPKILENSIVGGEGGVFVWGGSQPYLKYNRIADQVEEGVFVDRSSRPWLDRNSITGNGIGLAIWPSALPYDSTGVTGNRIDFLRLGGTP